MSETLIPAQKTNNLAVISLASGALSLPMACCVSFLLPPASCIALPLAILAIVLGFIARRQIRESDGAQTGEKLALAGIILGAIWVALFVLSCCVIAGLTLSGEAVNDVFENISATLESQ